MRLLALFLLAACASDGVLPEADTCGHPDDSAVAVMTTLSFARRADDGTTPGFDLDGIESISGDSRTCGHADLVDGDGRPGIDSALSALLPALELTEAAAIEGLIQASINTGELLMFFQQSRLDDPMDDDCVDITLLRGEGTPMVGTDGLLLDGQTFARKTDIAPVLLEGVAMEGGTARAGPFEMRLPLRVLDAQLDFLLMDTWIELSVRPDGTAEGLIGGAVDIDQIIEIAVRDDVNIGDIVIPLVEAAADMHRDDTGACQAISAVLAFTATPAFFYAE